jgi:iron complex transport system permease protein
MGGLVLLVADWLGRNIIFPFQVPAGLFATLVGGPFLLVLLGKRP